MGDIFTVTLPDIGEGVVEGEVIEWLKQVNDPLKQDEPVVVVMTDKATVELPAPVPGVLAKQYYTPGQVAIKGKPLYDIATDAAVQAVKKEEQAVQQVATAIPPTASYTRDAGKVLAAPPTRLMARELGIDISAVPGTGKNGIVTKEDLSRYHQGNVAAPITPPTSLPGDDITPLIGIRSLMAKRMAESKAMIPHFSYFEQADASRLVQLRQNIKAEASEEGIHVTYMPLLIRALSLTLSQYPIVNSSLEPKENSLIIHKQHNIGIAITTPLGLIVPVLKNVQDKSLQQIIKEFEELKSRATANKLLPSDMKEGTITISNFGVLGGGGLWATPVINYPEVAILAVAKIHKEPVIKNDAVVVRDVLNLSWSFDHRVIDGDQAATFSHHFSNLIANPAPLL